MDKTVDSGSIDVGSIPTRRQNASAGRTNKLVLAFNSNMSRMEQLFRITTHCT